MEYMDGDSSIAASGVESKGTIMSTSIYRSKVMAGVTSNSYVMFIDPGIDGAGWAHFRMVKPENIRGALSASGVIPHTAGTWDFNARQICRAFESLHKKYDPTRVVFEFPETWMNSAKSQAATAKGDLLKLACLIGGMKYIADEWTNLPPVFVLPREWKGQLPKQVVVNRVARIIGRVPVNHEADAIGMAIAAVMGRI
jgi:Holliday junction resolvasome RuvABC endonuclease subunit